MEDVFHYIIMAVRLYEEQYLYEDDLQVYIWELLELLQN